MRAWDYSDIASVCTERIQRCYGDSDYYVCLIGGKKQPPSIVLRWEWQRRVIIEPE